MQMLSTAFSLASARPVLALPQDGAEKEPLETNQTRLFAKNSFGFCGNLYVSSLWTLGGPNGEKPMFSAAYRRHLSQDIGVELQLRYMNVFLNRENLISGSAYPLRWLNTIWGTDILFITRPLSSIAPSFRLGIGPSLDLISTLQTVYTNTYPNDPTKTLKRQNYYLVSYLGGLAKIEYTLFTPNSLDIGLHLQVNVQTALAPRPFYPLPYPISGGLLFGVYVRTNW